MESDENRETLQAACESHGWMLQEMPATPFADPAVTTVKFEGGAVLSAKGRTEEANADAIVQALLAIGGTEVFEP